jgi:putative glycosyltransferase (TIGR04372 family)
MCRSQKSFASAVRGSPHAGANGPAERPSIRQHRHLDAKLRNALRPWKGTLLPLYMIVAGLFRISKRLTRKLAKACSDLAAPAIRFFARRFTRGDLAEYTVASPLSAISNISRSVTKFLSIAALIDALRSNQWDEALRIARLANLIFHRDIRARQLPITSLYVQALYRAGRHRRIIAGFSSRELLADDNLCSLIGAAHIYEGDPNIALFYLDRATKLQPSHPFYYRLKGRAYLVAGDEEDARKCFEMSAVLGPHTVMAHMNYAGRYDNSSYSPKRWELRDAGDLLIFDNYGQLAEEMMHLGYLSRGLDLYQQMLRKQQAYSYGSLPDALISRLAGLSRDFDSSKPTRILGYEWVIQFGHMGYLDLHRKMTLLGMYPDANYVLLAPKEKVSNSHLLTYWERYFTIVQDPDIVAELFPWQRVLADGFNAYPGKGDRAEHWTSAAARAQIEWAKQKRKPLLTVSTADRDAGKELIAKLGLPADSWYVGVHVREGSFYGEEKGHMSLYRNSDIDDYFPALKEIVRQGGYVIRLGDSSMRRLPEMPGVIDYAHSAYKSAAADIFFCATSRFVIGTTSGLTNASLCFGTPMLIVNSISSDWQLWGPDTDFILKRMRNVSENRFLSLQETYSDPTQGYLMNAAVMHRHGLEAIPNNADDILKAVKYKLGKLNGVLPSMQEAELLEAYRKAIAHNPAVFGAAQPVPSFLESYPQLLGQSHYDRTMK